jgi:cobalt/nickel transport system permease protein
MPSLLHTAARPHESRLGIDPRARLLTAVVLSTVTVVAGRLETIGVALVAALVATLVSRQSPKVVAKRLLPLNVLMLLLVLLLPLSTPGETLFQLGPMRFSCEGLRLAIAIAMKGNAVLLWLVALLGTMDPITLGHALSHLRVPDKLTPLLLFTVRYLDVLHREYLRLRAAMKARGFRPRLDRHTCRSIGYLVGMLLVRSFDRAERILAAMKCRGFRGHFFILDHFAFGRRDATFCMAATALAVFLLAMEWK